MMKEKITEKESKYGDIDQKSITEILEIINAEDATVSQAIKLCIPQIEKAVELALDRLQRGGKVFYIGSGTSGRLGIVDASECPPTFGVPFDLFNGIIAGGDAAIRRAQEGAEDDMVQAAKDLQQAGIDANSFVLGISASGYTPYVVGTLQYCMEKSIATGCIVCNPETPIAALSNAPIECITGPEVISGSTRMKAGTAQKLILNMFSTTLMVKMGKVQGNKMIDMQLTNQKLKERGALMLSKMYGVDIDEAMKVLLEHGSVRKAIEFFVSSKLS
jgi:N-acetylmuramic acid 6-phosphate etherase